MGRTIGLNPWIESMGGTHRWNRGSIHRSNPWVNRPNTRFNVMFEFNSKCALESLKGSWCSRRYRFKSNFRIPSVRLSVGPLRRQCLKPVVQCTQRHRWSKWTRGLGLQICGKGIHGIQLIMVRVCCRYDRFQCFYWVLMGFYWVSMGFKGLIVFLVGFSGS